MSNRELVPYDSVLGQNQRETADYHLLETLHLVPVYTGIDFLKCTSIRAHVRIQW